MAVVCKRKRTESDAFTFAIPDGVWRGNGTRVGRGMQNRAPRRGGLARAGRPGGQASRRVRGSAAHRAADRAAACKTLSVCYLPCRAPRQGAAARWGHRALPPRDTSVEHGGVADGNGHEWRAPQRGAGGAVGWVYPEILKIVLILSLFF